MRPTRAGEPCDVARRRFLTAAVGGAAGLWLGVHARRVESQQALPRSPFDAWIQVTPEGEVLLWVAKAEMGQGVLTALPMLLAEELDVELARVSVRQAPVDPTRYDHLTVGSSSIESLWVPLRTAGARARVALIAAAAARWRVPRESCSTDSGTVIGPAVQRLAYGELLGAAAMLIDQVPSEVRLRGASEYRVIGHALRRLDAAAKTDGSAVYGIDVRVARMLHAVIARSPVPGGRLEAFDATAARAVRGVRAVLAVPPVSGNARTRGGVAVVADTTWAALEARRRLTLTWQHPRAPLSGTQEIRAALRDNVARPGTLIVARGEDPGTVTPAGQTMESTYELPFLAHATMEPMNATVAVHPDRVEAWLPTQNAADARTAIAGLLGRSPDTIIVHQTLIGGGFGRRDATDFVVEAAQVAALVDQPVQVLWSREDDLRFDRYRPAAVHRLSAVLTEDGGLRAWRDRLSSTSIGAFLDPGANPAETEVGGACDVPYDIAAFRMEYTPLSCPVPVGWWRSVEDSINAFAVECFIDELATACRRDALEYRLALLAGARRVARRDGTSIETARLAAVLTAAARKARWSEPRPPGRALGLACHACRGSYAAVVAEISARAGQLVARRLWAAVDCGQVVNPLGAEAQISGGLLFGLSAALGERVTIERGATRESNFDDYPLLRIGDSPVTDVEFLPSTAAPSGIGELAVPLVAPALCNAWFRLTGRRVTTLPLTPPVPAAVMSHSSDNSRSPKHDRPSA
jgi:isoquinoline 1-oxidoreductase beta subunit